MCKLSQIKIDFVIWNVKNLIGLIAIGSDVTDLCCYAYGCNITLLTMWHACTHVSLTIALLRFEAG